jgi:hypothetical protein
LSGVGGGVPGLSGVGAGVSGVPGGVPGLSGVGCAGCAGCVGCGRSGFGLSTSGGSGTGYGVGSFDGGGPPGLTGTGRGFGSTGTGVGVCARAEPATAITSEALSARRPRSCDTARVSHERGDGDLRRLRRGSHGVAPVVTTLL